MPRLFSEYMPNDVVTKEMVTMSGSECRKQLGRVNLPVQDMAVLQKSQPGRPHCVAVRET
jgi:hypothetical protein